MDIINEFYIDGTTLEHSKLTEICLDIEGVINISSVV